MRKCFFDLRALAKSLALSTVLFGWSGPAFAQDNAEIVFWQSVSNSNSIPQLQAYIDAFPDGVFRVLADIRIRELSEAGNVPPARSTNTVTAAPVVPSASPQDECDRLAGHSEDATLTVEATSFGDLKTHADRAIEACLAAHERREDPRHTFQLARAYWAGGQEHKALELYEDAANRGHARAQYRLGRAYNEGLFGATEDIPRALQLFTDAAKQGQAIAAHEAGWILVNGYGGVEVNNSDAFILFDYAVENGVSRSLYPLGFMYEHGLNGEKSEAKAMELYRRAVAEDAPYINAARKQLSGLILAYTFYSSLFDPSRDHAGILDEALGLLRARSDSSQSAHEDYVKGLVQALEQMGRNEATEVARQDDPTDVSLKLAALRKAYHPLVENALNSAYALFPGDYPEFTPDKTRQLSRDYQSAMDAVVQGAREHGAKERYASENPAQDCVIFTSVPEGTLVHVTADNRCTKPVKVAVQLETSQGSTNNPDEAETFKAEIGAGERRQFSLPAPSGVALRARPQAEACYADAATMLTTWENGQHTCDYYFTLTNATVGALVNRTRELSNEIIAAR